MSNEKQFDFPTKMPKSASVKWLVAHRLDRFRRDEEGAIVALTLFIFLLFLVMAGIGIDTMRHEMHRTHLAAVSDAASLAGAGAANSDDAKMIVEDYFAKNGMSENLKAFKDGDVNITLNTSKVTVNAGVTIDTYLMQLSGIETLSASTVSTAEKRVPKLEIALVLDVSGSMAGDKLANLKVAAKQFVTTILNSTDPGDAVISVIPFSFGVTPSEEMYHALTATVAAEKHEYSTCLVFQNDDFFDTAIDPAVAYPQQIYTSRYDVNGKFNTLNLDWRSCYTDDYFRILPYSISETDLHNKIDSLQAAGNTSGHLGIKWAAAMLDPKFRSVTRKLITDNVVDGSQSNVPADYDEFESQKVVVMMGDGKNTASYYFNDPNGLTDKDTATSHDQADFRGPGSDLWRMEYTTDVFDYAYKKRNPSKTSTDSSKCSNKKWRCVYTTADKTSYFLHDVADSRYWDIDEEEWMSEADFQALPSTLGPNFIRRDQLDWEEAWGLMSPNYHEDITGSSAAYNDYTNQSTIYGSTKNTRMANSCGATKGRSIVIFTIGFEVAEGGTAETHLKSCATSNAHYYRAQGVNINDAFNSIASNVQNLRLTQ